jgi:hypothetical protein
MALTMGGGALIERNRNMYQVLTVYSNGRTSRGPMEEAEPARERYAFECGRIYKGGGIVRVLLCKGGIVVAQATC